MVRKPIRSARGNKHASANLWLHQQMTPIAPAAGVICIDARTIPRQDGGASSFETFKNAATGDSFSPQPLK